MNAPLTFEAVHARADGRWSEILAALGIEPNALRNRHGPCPGCGGKDRFRFDDKDVGRFYCNAGGADPVSGDGFKLLQHVYGWSAGEALERVAEVCGMDGTIPAALPPRPMPATSPEPSRTAAYARELWLRANKDDTAVAAHPYAINKGIHWAAGVGRGIASGRRVGQGADCLIIPIRTDGIGKVQGVECINPDGVKQTFGNKAGGCLVLGNTLDRRIQWYVAEGWASAVSMVFHHSRGNAVCAVAFGKDQLMRVAEMLNRSFDPHDIRVLKEQD